MHIECKKNKNLIFILSKFLFITFNIVFYNNNKKFSLNPGASIYIMKIFSFSNNYIFHKS